MFHGVTTGDGDLHRIANVGAQVWVFHAINSTAHAYESHLAIEHGAHERVLHRLALGQPG